MDAYRPYALCVLRVVAGLVFLQHGLEKLVGFAGAPPEPRLSSLRGIGSLLETIGGPMLALGLFTRPTAFILSGEMAVAYFRRWAPNGFFPIANGGEEAALNAYIFLWLAAAGAGAWSLDALIQRRRGVGALGRRAAAWEPQVRSVLRLIVGFFLTLRGLRKIFGVLLPIAARRDAPQLALDALPPVTGYLELAGGVLLMLGLFARPVAGLLALESLLAYALIAQPLALWPTSNGGNEALLYAVVLLYFAAAGAGAWSVDARWRERDRSRAGSIDNPPA